MRIAISGAANTGKSTLLNRFLGKWPMYTTPSQTYRDVIKNNNLSHSSKTSAETQLEILKWMLDEQDKYPKGSKVIYDRCPWDNLAYTLQANENDLISDEVTAATIDIVKASLKNLDIIFWIKYNPDIKIVNDGLRDTNIDFIKKTDEIFTDLYGQYADHLEKSPFYIAEDCPAIIPVEGLTIDDRVAWIGEFIDVYGNLIETEESILDPSNLDTLESLIKDQESWIQKDNQFKKLTSDLKKLKYD